VLTPEGLAREMGWNLKGWPEKDAIEYVRSKLRDLLDCGAVACNQHAELLRVMMELDLEAFPAGGEPKAD
jgi:hypothetical protein